MLLVTGTEDGTEYMAEQKVTDVSAGCTDEPTSNYGYGFAWRRTGIIGEV